MKFPASKHHQVINIVQIDSNNSIRRLPGVSECHLILTQLRSRVMPASDKRVPDLILKLSWTLNNYGMLTKPPGRMNSLIIYIAYRFALSYHIKIDIFLYAIFSFKAVVLNLVVH